MNGIQKVYVVNTQDLTGLTTDIDANLLAAAMRITGSTRVRYLLGAGRPAHRRGHGHLRRRHVQERRLRRRLGHRHERGATVLTFVTGGAPRRDRPGHRGQHRRQRAQQPRLDGRRLPAAAGYTLVALEHHRPRRRVHAERTRRRLDLGRRRPCPGALCAPDWPRPTARLGTITGCSATTLVYRYWLSGQWGTGAVKLTFLPEAWSYQVTVGLPTAADHREPLAPGNSTLVLQLSGLPSGWVLDTASWTALKALLSDAWTETTDDGPGGAPAGQRLPDPRRPQQRLGDHPARRRRAVLTPRPASSTCRS